MVKGRRRKTRGLTLVEIIISSSILVIVFAALHQVLFQGLEITRRIDSMLSLDRQAMNALRECNFILRESNMHGVEIEAEAMVFPLPRTNSNDWTELDGNKIYSSWNSILRDNTNDRLKLYRRELTLPQVEPPVGSEQTPVIDAASLTSNFEFERTLAHDVSFFQVEELEDDVLRLRFEFFQDNQGKILKVRLESLITLSPY